MKESTLLEMKNKVETAGAVLQRVVTELTHLKDLTIGTMELVKRLDGYEEALNKLKEEHGKKDTNGTATGYSEPVATSFEPGTVSDSAD